MTINEIAKLAGVSISTVSKIVNNKADNLNPETRDRVLKIVKDYNYSPYASAKNNPSVKAFILGVLLKDAPQTNQLLTGIMDVAQKNGYSILLYDSCNSQENELRNITSLCKNNADGVIWEPVTEQSLENEHYFTEQNIEVCCIDSPNGSASYRINYEQIGYDSTRTLIDYKHSKLCCMMKKNSIRSAMVFEGFKKCLYDNQIPFSENMRLDIEQKVLTSEIFSRNISGIVSSHYSLALILLEELNKFKYRVPYDLSLISLRDDVREAISFPRISSIKIPYLEFGEFLCENLIAKCEKKASSSAEFQTEFQLENTLSLDMPRSMRTKNIVVVGSINIDITLNVDELPHPGNTVITDRFSVITGGKGANQAVGVAKLGMDVSLIGKVGNDYNTSLIYNSLEEHHIEMQGICRDYTTETGKAYIHVQDDGESTITILTGANQKLCAADIISNQRLFENAGYCLLQTEIPEAALEVAAKTAKEHGAKNILKPSALKQLSDSLMKNIDIFIPNQKEAELLCPDLDSLEDKADYFLTKGVAVVIITLGHSGCYVKTPDFSKSFPAADFKVADTTGACDAFISALAVYLLTGYSLEKSVKIATYAAGFSISRQGVIPSLIDRSSLEIYINRLEPDLL